MPSAEGLVAVTGAGGYLGGRLTVALGERGRGIGRAPVAWLPAAGQVPCDLLGPAAGLDAAFAGVSTVIHLAGHNEVVASEDPDRATAETVAMAEAVAAAAQRAGADRLVYVSTIHVYGSHLQPGAVLDESTPSAPTSPYATARARCEDVVAASRVDAVVLRLSNAVGAAVDPHVDRWTLVASDLSRQAVLDRTMVLRSTGQQWRDFIALEDAVRLVLGTIDPAVATGTYNLAAGQPRMVRSLAELIQDRVQDRCGFRPELQAPAPTDDPDPAYTIAVDALAAQGLRAEVPLEDAVDEIIDHCVKHETTLREARNPA